MFNIKITAQYLRYKKRFGNPRLAEIGNVSINCHRMNKSGKNVFFPLNLFGLKATVSHLLRLMFMLMAARQGPKLNGAFLETCDDVWFTGGV